MPCGQDPLRARAVQDDLRQAGLLGGLVQVCAGEVPTGPWGRLECGHESPPAMYSPGSGTEPPARSPAPTGAALQGEEGIKTLLRLPRAQSSPRTVHHPALGHLRAHPAPHSMTVTFKIRHTSALWKFGLFGPDDLVSLKFRFNYITNILVKHYRAHRPSALRQGSAPAPGLPTLGKQR